MKIRDVETWLWRLLLVWTALQFGLLPFDLGVAQVRSWAGAEWIKAVLFHLLSIADAVWVVLAAAFTYVYLARQEGLAGARRAALVILAGSSVLCWVNVHTGLPFGPRRLTGQLSAGFAGVPFALPLLWLVIVAAARYTVLHFRVHATRWQLALGTGLLALLTDLSLETIAWKVRAWWLWYFPAASTPDWPPAQNYLSWFVFPAMLAWAAFPAARPVGRQMRPAILLGLINLLFWTSIAVRWSGR